MKNLFLIGIACLMIYSCNKPQIGPTENNTVSMPWIDSSNRHPKHAAFTHLLEKYNKLGLPGISLLITDSKGTWVGAAGKADIGEDVTFTPATVSKVASITKLLVASLVFKLMEDSTHSGLNYRSLDMPVNTWIPRRITDKLPNGNVITLGQLMKHETGIPDLNENNEFYLAVLNNPNKKWDAEELLSFYYGKKPIFKPGDTAIYSNTNTVLVSMVIEYATGKKHADLLKEKIFVPLSMNHTYYQPLDELPNTTAQGYYDLYNNNSIVNVSNLVTGSGNGYGGVYSNVFDLQKFINGLLINKTLLSPKSLDIMQSFGKTDGSNRYGYGIMKKFIERGDNAGIGHSGRDVGYTANLFYFPAKNVVHIFFINYGTDGNSKLREVFQNFQDELIDLTFQ